MTYNDGYIGEPAPGTSYGMQSGPMALDIAILQALYGANTTYANGDDTYELPDANATGIAGGFTIANGVVIENAVSGDGNDTLTGDGGRNYIYGADGDDTIEGGSGTDTADDSGFDSNAFTVVDLAGADWPVTEIATGHADTLISIEMLVFDDMTLVA